MADAPRKNRKVNGHGGGPIGGFQKPKETKKTVKRLLSYMGQHPVMLIVAFLCVIASALASVGATYITRQSVHTAANVRKCKKAIRKAFENAMAGNGFSLVEVVSTCNSGWKLSPVASNQWLAENMLPFYPLGDIKDVKKE